MLSLIMYRAVRPLLAKLMLWVEHHWPNQGDLYHPDSRLWPADDEAELDVDKDDTLLDYVVRHDVQVPDDARELTQ